jgi:Tol biopolymer transport system component
MSARRSTLLGALALAMLVLAVPVARADFTEASLDSGNSAVQADYAYEPAMSADGTYVAFTGSLGGISAIYRKDLATGELDVVAYGDAGAPSISADGRYVSFTTTDADPGDPATATGALCTTVYVRDMDSSPEAASPTAPAPISGSAYTLASAVDGSPTGLTYAGSGTSGCPGGGAATAPGASITADGNEVVFTVVGRSDLTTGDATDISTPAAQVAVRNLSAQTTTLVSQTLGSLGLTPSPVPGGAAMTDDSAAAGPGNQTAGNADDADSTATISADGSTVAWLAINIPSQAAAQPQDAPGGTGTAAGDYPDEYDEPLWRKIADGPSAPTDRILGEYNALQSCSTADCEGPLDFQWLGEESPPTATGPDRGSLLADDGFQWQTDTSGGTQLTLSNGIPSLSADGNTVAVLSTQPLVSQLGADGNIPCKPCLPNLFSTNAYVINMASGLNRSQAVKPLTEWGSYDFESDFQNAGTLTGIRISPEGDEVGFVTERSNFPLSPPTLISPPLTQAADPQLYIVNISDGTMELATTGYDGQPANGQVQWPSFSDDGGPIAFASGATNLVYGAESDLLAEGVIAGSEVFTMNELQPTLTPGHSVIGTAPAPAKPKRSWSLKLIARSLRNGDAAVSVGVPGAGSLALSARSAVVKVGRGVRSRPQRLTLARGAKRAPKAETIRMVLAPGARDRKLISRAKGLYATVSVTFTAPGHRRLTAVASVEFMEARR